MLTPIWLKVSPPHQTFPTGSELKVWMKHFAYILSSSVEESLSWCNKGLLQTDKYASLTFLQISKRCFDISAIFFTNLVQLKVWKLTLSILPLSQVWSAYCFICFPSFGKTILFFVVAYQQSKRWDFTQKLVNPGILPKSLL